MVQKYEQKNNVCTAKKLQKETSHCGWIWRKLVLTKILYQSNISQREENHCKRTWHNKCNPQGKYLL